MTARQQRQRRPPRRPSAFREALIAIGEAHAALDRIDLAVLRPRIRRPEQRALLHQLAVLTMAQAHAVAALLDERGRERA